MSAALQEGVARPSDVVDCQMGSIVVAGRLIHDWHPFGLLTVEQVLINSSDVGSIKVALRLGAPKYYQYIRSFGFGQVTGIKLPGENPGLLRPVDEWTPSSIGSIAIGQEVSVTPIQMISAESVIANGGTLRRPRIIREVARGKQTVMRENPDPRRVISESTAATMREMMEQVVLEGTGRPAQPFGYTAAGKTGTAQKINPATGRYSKKDYYASFIGYAPVNNPAVTILVTLDSPMGGHEGGPTAGPVFKEVAEQVLAYLNVPHDMPPLPTLEKASLRQPARQTSFATRDTQFDASFARRSKRAAQAMPPLNSAMASVPEASTVAIAESQAVTVPNFVGQSVRRVTEACLRLGLTPILIGDGIALDQSPEPGTKVLPGAKVSVSFGSGAEVGTPATGN